MDAEEVVAEAIEHVAMEAKLRESTITSECEHGLSMKGDRRRLILALTNLLGNAVKHGPTGSPIEVLAARDGDSVRFTVRDHGTGFPVADTGHLFDKYFRSVAERQRKVPGKRPRVCTSCAPSPSATGGPWRLGAFPGSGAEFDMTIPLHREEVSA